MIVKLGIPKQLIFGRLKEKARKHPLIRLSRGFDAEDAYSSISGSKVYYWVVPKVRTPRFPTGIYFINFSWCRLTKGAAVSGAFLAYLWAVKYRPRREGNADYSLKTIFSNLPIYYFFGDSKIKATLKSCIKLIFKQKIYYIYFIHTPKKGGIL